MLSNILFYCGFVLMGVSIIFGIFATTRRNPNNTILKNGVNISILGIMLGNLLVACTIILNTKIIWN